jgi:hypothetical protein
MIELIVTQFTQGIKHGTVLFLAINRPIPCLGRQAHGCGELIFTENQENLTEQQIAENVVTYV